MPNDTSTDASLTPASPGRPYLLGPGREAELAGRDLLVERADQALIHVTGAEAAGFLQSQLTNDVRSLAGAVPAAYCTAQGRVLGLFLVIPWVDGFVLQTDQTVAEALLRRLRMFVLRAKVTLTPAPLPVPLGIAGAHVPQILADSGLPVPDTAGALGTTEGLTVMRLPGSRPRFELLGAALDHPRLAPLRERLTPAGTRAWAWLDIQEGIPSITAATAELFVPQMLNLDVLQGISFKKGCYPGQEIVARTHYLGRLKQRMYRARVRSEQAVAPGAALFAPNFPGQSVGTVVDAELSPDGQYELLAVIQIASVEAGVVSLAGAEGPPLQWETLPYALGPPSG